jgi:hypothetical protein
VANNLVGTFPKELAFLNSLEVYVGQFNPGMTGKFPEGFRTLPSLKHVEVSMVLPAFFRMFFDLTQF